MAINRRDFLKGTMSGALLGASGLGLSSCSHFEELILGETRDMRGTVVIIGGGLAGLTAASELKKNGIPYRLYEGSSRVGGRVLSIPQIDSSFVDADLGAEWVSESNQATFELAKEFKIRLLSVTSDPWAGLSKVEQGRLLKLFRKIEKEIYGQNSVVLNSASFQQYSRAVKMDEISAKVLFEKLSSDISPEGQNIIEKLIAFKWGVSPSEISALAAVEYFSNSKTYKHRLFKIEGGTGVLTEALLQRVAGVIPERFLKFHHKVVSIEENAGVFEVQFETLNGTSLIRTDQMIWTLPLSISMKVNGFTQVAQKLGVLESLKTISYAKSGKSILALKSETHLDYSDLVFLNGGQAMLSRTGLRPSNRLAKPAPYLSCEWHKETGENLSRVLSADKVKAIQSLLKNFSYNEEKSYHKNWSLHPWSRLSKHVPGPGYYQQRGVLQIAKPLKFLWAGDAYSETSMGDMESAISSAKQAAKAIIIG